MIRRLLPLCIVHCALCIPAAPPLDFGAVASISIGTNEVQSIAINGETVWTAPSALPYNTEVSYIEATGTQWIDTGLVIEPGMRMDVDMMVVNWDATTYSLTGAGGIRFTFGKGYSGSSGNAGANAGRLYFGLGSQNLPTTTALSGLAGARHMYSVDAGTATAWLDGTTSWSLSSAGTISTGVNHILLFAQSTGTGGTQVRGQQAARLYGAKFTVNGVLVRDFVPVSIGVEGALYDRVSGTLFTNQGTGSFGIP